MAQAPIGSSTRKRKDARLHLHSQSVFPEVSCSQQAISLIDAVWINFPGSGRLVGNPETIQKRGSWEACEAKMFRSARTHCTTHRRGPIKGNVKRHISPSARCRHFFVSAFSPNRLNVHS